MILNQFVEIGNGFYNLKAPFFGSGFINKGTHMSLLRLRNGRFIVLDTCGLSAGAKAELDILTVNGTLIDAVIATHSFHTTYFESFYEMYPTLNYYGTPRHIRLLKKIEWKGDVNMELIRTLWEPEVTSALLLTPCCSLFSFCIFLCYCILS